MTEVEHNIIWAESSQHEKAHLSFDQAYADTGQNEQVEEFADIPMIIVESNQETAHTDAPIVIYPNDPSVVGAEEVVEEEVDFAWEMHHVEKEEEVAPMNEEYYDSHSQKPLAREDFSDIPLNDESYATFHPFPCDFCARRFKKKANLINHMVAHQTQRPHCCTICSSRFMRRCDLVNHQKIHAYIPNRDNRKDLDTDPAYIAATQRRDTRRRKSSYSGKKRLARDLSPLDDPDEYNINPTNYVDEDVKLLLEMTSKLHESRKSESDGGGSSSNVKQLERNVSGSKRILGTEKKPYVCTKCNRCFARESAMISHSQVHAEDSSHYCTKCGSRFFTLELLKDHYSRKHGILYKEGSSDGSDQERGGDRGWYTGDERFGTFHCNICDKNFHKSEDLRQHKKIHMKEEYTGLYTCHTCQSLFLTNDKLLEHLDISDKCQNNVCLLCAEQFSNQGKLKTHIADLHTDRPLFTCRMCGKQCRDVKHLKKHTMTHNPKRKATPSSKRFGCGECDFDFPDKRTLSFHQKGTHVAQSGGNQRRFDCSECGKSFSSRSSQQIHNRIHTGERPYGCRYCWKAFADGGTLRKHERIHTGEKPYVCAVCPRAFNQRVVLREHIRSHHSGSVSRVDFSTPVYACPVCDIITSGSDELALHIVKHSDDNTVRNRAPSTSTRPFRRRRKPEPPPTNSYGGMSEFDEADFFDNHNSDTESVESEDKRDTPRKKNSGARRTNTYTKFSKTIDAAMKNIASLVDHQPVRKAKMINSKMQTGSKVTAKRGVKKRGKRGPESSRAVVTVIKPRVRTLSGRLSGRRSSLDEFQEERTKVEEVPVEEEAPVAEKIRYGRPRTKNVNYETLRALNHGLPSATFPDMSVIKKDIKQETVAKPFIKEEVIDIDHVCNVCSARFNSKADLLFHVPVHI